MIQTQTREVKARIWFTGQVGVLTLDESLGKSLADLERRDYWNMRTWEPSCTALGRIIDLEMFLEGT